MTRPQGPPCAPTAARPEQTTTRHTPECLVMRIAAIHARLEREFPPVIADLAAGEVEMAGLLYYQKAQAGEVPDLENGGAWLWHIAIQAARRLSKRMLHCVSLEDVGDLAVGGFAAAEPDGVIHNALALLSPRQRQVIELHHFQDMPFRAIALELGIEVTARCVTTTSKAFGISKIS